MYHGGQAALLPSLSSPYFPSHLQLSTPPPVEGFRATVQVENPPLATPSFLSTSFEYPNSDPLAAPSSQRGSSSNPTSIVVTTSNSSELQSPMQLCGITRLLSTFFSFVAMGGLLRLDQTFKPKSTEGIGRIGSPRLWLDRTLCRSIGICGPSHMDQEHWRTSHKPIHIPSWDKDDRNASTFWMSGQEEATNWSDEERLLRVIPQYVLDHAPYVHLYSGESYWPGDIAEHLVHTTPHINYTPAPDQWQHPDLKNLGKLNHFGLHVFLQSDDNVEDDPDWLLGEENIPEKGDGPFMLPDGVRHDPGVVGHWNFHPDKQPKYHDPDLNKFRIAGKDGSPDESHPKMGTKPSLQAEVGDQAGSSGELKKRSVGGRSNAPVVLLVVDKGNDVVDAFWFYFYSYNLGNAVFGVHFGNHVGDWEHTAIRFHKGVPKLVFFSEHDFGQAYSWEAVEKYGDRPVSYSAVGTHAMYGTAGTHSYVLPFGILYDITDKGPLWDPILNMYSYTYDYVKDVLRSSTLNPQAPTSWFYFWGHWGDKFYPLSDPRQYRFAGQYHYVNGPLGPRFKRLERKHICQGDEEQPCNIKSSINSRNVMRKWKPVGQGEELSEEDLKRILSERKGAIDGAASA